MMDKLPPTIIQQIYEYDPTYNIKFDQVLTQLSAHCFIYRCRICFNEWDNCFCYRANCRTYLRFCQQIYYSHQNNTYEDELKMIIALGF